MATRDPDSSDIEGGTVDLVENFVGGTLLSAEWEIKYTAPDVLDPYVIGDARSHYTVKVGGEPATATWTHKERENLTDNGAYIGEAPLYFAEWFGPSGEPELAWRSYRWLLTRHTEHGDNKLYQKGSLLPSYTAPGDVLGAGKINGVIVIATPSGFYYWNTNANPAAWASCGGQDLIDHVTYYAFNSDTPSGWGMVRFSASGAKCASYCFCHHINSGVSEDNFSLRRFDATITETDGVVSFSGSQKTTKTLSGSNLIVDNYSQIASDPTWHIGECSGSIAKGDALPLLAQIDFDGEDVVELYLDITPSGSYSLYSQEYDPISHNFDPQISLSDTISVVTKAIIKKNGATVFEINCGTSSGSHTITGETQAEGGELLTPENFSLEIVNGRHIVWYDLRSQTFLGINYEFTSEASATLVWDSGTKPGTRQESQETTVPSLFVINPAGEYTIPVSAVQSQEDEDDFGGSEYSFDLWGSGNTLADYWLNSSQTLRMKTLYTYLTDHEYSLNHGGGFQLPTPIIGGLSDGSSIPTAQGKATKNGDILFFVNSLAQPSAIWNDDTPYRVSCAGLFCAETVEFTKLSDLYAAEVSPPDFQWDWNTKVWYDSHIYDLIYATRLRNGRNSQEVT